MSIRYVTAPGKIPLAAFAAFLVMTTPALAQLTDVGVNAAVRNEVVLQSAGDDAVRPAVAAEQVFLGDQVSSGEAAALQILLNDETVFTVGENCDMTIDEFVYDPSSQAGSIVASIQKGTFRFMSGKIATRNTDAVRINTPAGYLGVRGTMLDLAVGDVAVTLARESGLVSAEALEGAGDDAALVVLRGPGRDQSGVTKDGAAYINSGGDELTLWEAGTAAFVPRSGARIIGPFRLRDSVFLAFAGNLGSRAEGAGLPRPPRPPADLGRVTRTGDDLRGVRRPAPPGGPGGKPCPGECPNNQEEGGGQSF